jgi:predicted  nucleic acid-binding Zn-ribbon protein
MAKKIVINTVPIEEKLLNLFELQSVDSQIDNIERLKGELPMEVSELEDEIVGLDTRISKLQSELKEMELKLTKHQASILEAESLIQKYEKQQDNVKNNREYDALTREIELQKLDIQLANKRIREGKVNLGNKEATLEAALKKKDAKTKELEKKEEELKKIITKTEKDEKGYQKKMEKSRKKIEDRLLKAYDRIRSAYKNRLAVVTVERDSCGGCYNYIPPQVQLELGQRKRIISCEHCGRILVDREIAGMGPVQELEKEATEFGEPEEFLF